MTLSWAETARRVVARAAERCEYCRMHQSLQGATFHIEHAVPRVAGGSDSLDNLSLACPGCNLKKSDRVTLTDPDTGEAVRLYNPRADTWGDHFTLHGPRVVGLTGVGRAMVTTFDLNHPRRVKNREAEQMFGLFPPDDE